MRNKTSIAALLAAVLLLAAGGAGLWLWNRQQAAIPPPVPAQTAAPAAPRQTGSPAEPESRALPAHLVVEGVPLRRNTALKTVLFLGIDQSEAERDTVMLGGGGRADAILLMLLDPADETARLLEISRDTMIDMDVYTPEDEFLYTRYRQLTLQYSVGSSAARSNWLMKNKVSDLLYGMPVDYVLSLTMDGIAPVVEALGGVTLTFAEDASAIDPAFTAGSTLTLNGEQATRFVRTRDIEALGSNNDRMRRHEQLLAAVAAQLRGLSMSRVQEVLAAAGPYMETELDTEVLDRLRRYTLDPELHKAPGQTVEGEDHDEYLLDDEALRQMIIKLFYIPE